MIEALEDHFTNTLDLPPAAVDWLLDLWQVIQVFDDAHDGDPVGDVMPALWASLVSMPSNPFYVANAAALQGAVATAILKWHAANEAEDAGEADRIAFEAAEAAREAEAAEKAARRAEILERLGLTEDEAKLILEEGYLAG